MNKRTLILAGIGIFLAGVLAGAIGMGAFAKYRLAPVARMDKLGPAGFVMERLDHALKLSSEQEKAIRPIVEDVMRRIREVREPCIRAEEEALADGAKRIEASLGPDQKEKFKDFIEKSKERRKRFFGH